MKTLKQLNLYFLLLITTFSYSQDNHVSQPWAWSLYMNPSFAGNFDFDFNDKSTRFSAGYRQQWRSIPSNFVTRKTPFVTFASALDGKIRIPKLLRRNFLSYGTYFLRDKAGDLNLSNYTAQICITYNHSLQQDGQKYVSVGFNWGYVQKTIDFSDAYYDNQWNGKAFDPNLPSGESSRTNLFGYLDFSTGISFHNVGNNDFKYTSGLTFLHVNKPNQTFFANDNARDLYSHFILFGNGYFLTKNNATHFPTIKYMRQGPAGELLLTNYWRSGSQYQYDVQQMFGLGIRLTGQYNRPINADALVLAIKSRFKNALIGFSYDVNISSLKNATQFNGAYELGLVYHFGTDNKKIPHGKYNRKKSKCPKHLKDMNKPAKFKNTNESLNK